MIEITPAEARHRYREIGGDLPSDEELTTRYGDAATGAYEWLDEHGRIGGHDATVDTRDVSGHRNDAR